MAKNKKYKLADEFFIAEKTSDVFMEVEFEYKTQKWNGLLPKFLKFQGLDLTEEDFYNSVEESYNILNPDNRQKWITGSDLLWTATQKQNQTYKVLRALYSGNWECRVCGPVPAENPQPAARLGALKNKATLLALKENNVPRVLKRLCTIF